VTVYNVDVNFNTCSIGSDAYMYLFVPHLLVLVLVSLVTAAVPILRFKVRSTDAWRARRARVYNGVWGRSSQRGPRAAEPLVRGSGGAKPPEAESLLAFQRPITARKITSFTVSIKLP